MNQYSSKEPRKAIKLICCYEIEQTDDSPIDQPMQPEYSKRPMLTRAHPTNIHFTNSNQINRQPIYELLNELYERTMNEGEVYELLARKRINPELTSDALERDDIEYFIPQLVTYLVIEKSLEDKQLINLLLSGSATDFFFAHRVYFYLKSLSANHVHEEIKNVIQFIEEEFTKKMKIYQHCRLSGLQFARGMLIGEDQERQPSIADDLEENMINMEDEENQKEQSKFYVYGTKNYPQIMPINPITVCRIAKKRYSKHGFMETPQFWDDLISIGTKIAQVPLQNRSASLTEHLQQINESLPANIYVPFFKDRVRMSTVLCVWKGRVFSTKQRAPYSIWLQLYRQQEEREMQFLPKGIEPVIPQISQKQQKKLTFLENIYEKISKPFSISDNRNTLGIKKFFVDKFSVMDETIKPKKDNTSRSFVLDSYRKASMSQIYQSISEGQKTNSDVSSHSVKSENEKIEEESYHPTIDEYFPQKSSLEIQQRKSKSIYRDLKSWRMIHLMVKTGDDIKQEQFAMQLINRFQYIFKKEKIGCVVFPYEVVSLGPDCGAIEMLNDVITLDKLFEMLSSRKLTLKQFFESCFPDKEMARKNFMRSLAGYSLLTYFLQVKDRHNGNILLHRDGYIIHIDFGFFLSNAPGKGVQLEKKVPFKLLTQYVEVIGDLKSQEFFEFRRLFYKGFTAILKHKESILSLVRMMFSSHGQIMGCFIKGQTAIFDLQKRFSIQQQRQNFCYDLINQSLDNWRARWYDKFQYFLQKIYY